MRIFAQRVETEGLPIRSFIYLHQGVVWQGQPPPEMTLPAPTLEWGAPEGLGGNPVLSYFTVLAPDDVTPSEIGAAYARLHQAGSWTQAYGRCLAQFYCEQPLVAAWRSELQLLFLAAAAAHTAYKQPKPTSG